LVLAHQLARFGVPFRIVDKYAAPLELSQAAALHARAMEILEDIGVAERIVGEGQRVDRLVLRTKYRDRMRVDFTDLEDTRYPHMVDIPQNRTEHILIDGLRGRGVEVERAVLLTGFEQYPDQIEATLRHGDGTEEVCSAGWLVGCDGVKSTVRDLLGLGFGGDDYADDWVLCDAELEWPLPRNEMTFSSAEEGILGVFPLPGENRYRVAYTQNHDADGEPVPPSVEDMQRSLSRTGIEGRVLKGGDFWVFNLAHRQAKTFRRGRAFLAGDAGHVHTPFGGQGLNLGVGDAYNLGWKLALVVRGEAGEGLLDSYTGERHPVGERVIRTTHVGASAMLMGKGAKTYARDGLMAMGDSSQSFRRRMAYRLSQLEHNYRGTELVEGKTRRLRAGERAPDERFFDGLSGSYRSVFDLLDGTRFTLLLVDSGDEGPLTRGTWREIAEGVCKRYGGLIKTHLVTTDHRLPSNVPEGTSVWIDRGMDLSRYHQPGKTTAYLVRPDGHLACVHSPAQLGRLLSFLHRTPYVRPRTSAFDAPAPMGVVGGPEANGSSVTGAPAANRLEVVPVITPAVNYYVVRGQRGSVLVDTGFPGKADAVLERLKKEGVDPTEISLILLTHGHPDHAGNAAELRERLGVPVAIHALEADWMRVGKAVIPPPVRPFGRIIKATTKPEVPPFEPDVLLEEGTDLSGYGLDATILHTPGHSPGSVSVLLAGGDAIAGDLMAGGFVLEDRSGYMFLLDDAGLARRSIERLLSHRPSRLFFGHGRPASGESVRRRFSPDLALGEPQADGSAPHAPERADGRAMSAQKGA
jgi:2-polyprenyl-6-methoxyphenol hydroxylase-like FAD-dependent oxidoreductase/glyoxylase-like metal-dependent hydrolase (beta-lactamase superfamily II)